MGRGGLALVAWVVIGSGVAGGVDSQEGVRPSFSGLWALRPEESDDARAKMKEAMGEGRRGGRGGPMSGGPQGGPGGQGPMSGGPVGERGGPPTGGPMGMGPDPEQMAAMRQALDDALDAPESLLISQDGVAFEMVMDGERAVRLYSDGRKNKGASGISRKTRWEEDRLVTESKVGGGFGAAVKIVETWAIVPARATTQPASPAAAEPRTGGRLEAGGEPASSAIDDGASGPALRLAIITRLEGGPFEKPVSIRRLYERSSGR